MIDLAQVECNRLFAKNVLARSSRILDQLRVRVRAGTNDNGIYRLVLKDRVGILVDVRDAKSAPSA